MSANTKNTKETIQQAKQWWNGLEEQWKLAFNEGVLLLGSTHAIPGDEDLLYLYQDAENVRLAGPTAGYPNVSFKLTNLSGVKGMLKLSFLSVVDHEITSLKELSGLTNLRNLFVQHNQLTSLEGIENNKELVSLYVQGNTITSLLPLRNLLKLQELNVAENELDNLEGITPGHSDEMRQCFVLPNEKLRDRDILKLQNECYIIGRKS